MIVVVTYIFVVDGEKTQHSSVDRSCCTEMA